ncbi:MAG: hypothetical protein QM687_09325 [Ferruginibacter sp.]
MRWATFASPKRWSFPRVLTLTLPPCEPLRKLLDLTAVALGVSYFKLLAPLRIEADFPLTEHGRDFALDIYSNGLGEFYARNNLNHFGKIEIDAPRRHAAGRPSPLLRDRALLPIGGGKDSLVSRRIARSRRPRLHALRREPQGPDPRLRRQDRQNAALRHAARSTPR